MTLRKITSLTALIASLFTMFTSIILYIVPAGRVAYWSDWHLLGLSKTEWGNIHINFGFLFILSILLHIYYNWKPILNYLKDKQKNLKIFTKDFNVALIICIAVALGTYFMIPPFSSILDLSGEIKDKAAQKYGEPPFGHAELAPLKSLAKKMGLDLNQSMNRLEKAGINIDSPSQIFLEIAKNANKTPKEVYDIIRTREQAGGKKTLPAIPAPGLGKKTFLSLCKEYQLKPDNIIAALKLKGIEISENKPMKENASANSKAPIELYDLIKEISDSGIK